MDTPVGSYGKFGIGSYRVKDASLPYGKFKIIQVVVKGTGPLVKKKFGENQGVVKCKCCGQWVALHTHPNFHKRNDVVGKFLKHEVHNKPRQDDT